VLIGAVHRGGLSESARAAAARAGGQFVETFYAIFIQMLEWVVEVVPFAVFLVVADVVGKSGLGVFKISVVVPVRNAAGNGGALADLLSAGGMVRRPKAAARLPGEGADAILTSLSCNSSLATVPVTLRGLERMGVSPQSARLSACVGTQLNNDGNHPLRGDGSPVPGAGDWHGSAISQADDHRGFIDHGRGGIAGIPEAGLIVLPLVLGARWIPDVVIAAALPLIISGGLDPGTGAIRRECDGGYAGGDFAGCRPDASGSGGGAARGAGGRKRAGIEDVSIPARIPHEKFIPDHHRRREILHLLMAAAGGGGAGEPRRCQLVRVPRRSRSLT